MKKLKKKIELTGNTIETFINPCSCICQSCPCGCYCNDPDAGSGNFTFDKGNEKSYLYNGGIGATTYD